MIAEVMIDECDNCGVLWFDRGELEVYRKKYYTKEIDKDVLFNQFKKFKEIEDSCCPKCESDNYIICKKDKEVLGRCSSCSGIFFSKCILDKLILQYERSETFGSMFTTYFILNGTFSIVEMILDLFGGD
jgi:Zn-finger nucleic acid-binding protein